MKHAYRILVIEDDRDLHAYLHAILQDNNYISTIVANGAGGLEAFDELRPDLVILDINLPDIKGESVLLEIRKRDSHVPIVMLTAKNDTQTKVQSLTGGADDYITKPFDSTELVARIHARLRPIKGQKSMLRIGDLELDPVKVEVKRAGKSINLTPQEFKLLEYLMNNKGIVLSRDMILDRIWEYSQEIETRVVDVYMGYLRKKIETGFEKKIFYSIRGFGYTIKDS